MDRPSDDVDLAGMALGVLAAAGMLVVPGALLVVMVVGAVGSGGYFGEPASDPPAFAMLALAALLPAGVAAIGLPAVVFKRRGRLSLGGGLFATVCTQAGTIALLVALWP